MTEQSSTSDPVTAAGPYTVVARRYRPQTFDELIGQEHVARALKQAITSDRVGHAYLFTGARGVGKTSAARVLAKALNCEQGPTPQPCNECDICQRISSGDDVDVLEIDGASNRGIDEIRQLRQNVAVRPSRARLKVYIIDEVHMLTKEAFNALLKTLEEPPEHVKFIFATTEPNKIPITILSRCQRFDFAGIAARSIQSRLTQIAKAEGVGIENEAVQILAARAAGSMRDSQSLLEQLLAVANGTITAADVNSLLGIAPAQRLSQLVEHLAERNAAAALEELDATLAGGVDPGQLLDQLVGYFRDVMASSVGCDAEQLLYALPTQIELVKRLAGSLGVNTVLAVLQILDQTAARLRVSLHSRTLVEMAIVRICNLENLDDLSSVLSELRKNPGSPVAPVRPRQETPDAPAGAQRPKANSPQPPPAQHKNRSPASSSAESHSAENGSAENGSPVSDAVGESSPRRDDAKSLVGNLSESEARRLWESITSEVGGLAASYAAVTDEVTSTPAGELIVRFGPHGVFAHAQCQRAETQRQLLRVAEGLCGAGIMLRFELSQPAPTESGETASQPRISKRQRSAEAAERPFVKKALALFEVEPGDFNYNAGEETR